MNQAILIPIWYQGPNIRVNQAWWKSWIRTEYHPLSSLYRILTDTIRYQPKQFSFCWQSPPTKKTVSITHKHNSQSHGEGEGESLPKKEKLEREMISAKKEKERKLTLNEEKRSEQNGASFVEDQGCRGGNRGRIRGQSKAKEAERDRTRKIQCDQNLSIRTISLIFLKKLISFMTVMTLFLLRKDEILGRVKEKFLIVWEIWDRWGIGHWLGIWEFRES